MLQRQLWILIWTATALSAKEGPRCPPSIAPERCREDGAPLDEFFFVINGERMHIVYKANYLHITCLANITLENEEMPRFRTAVEVPLVKLTACPPPSVPYVDALLALNVTPGTALELAQTPPAPALRADHLRGLRVGALTLSGAAPLAPADALLQALPALRDLRLSDVVLTPAAAAHMPPDLRALSLKRAGLAAGLPDAALKRAPGLRRLTIHDPSLTALNLSVAPALADATVEAPLTELVLGPALANLTLTGASRVAGACNALRRLVVERAVTPDPSWLAGCAGLEALAVRHCALSELPTQWLEDAPALLSLDLSHNNLEALPGEMISLAKQLEELNLSNNRLRHAAVEVVAALPRLADLALDRNPLGDLCGGGESVQSNGQSPLWNARGLRRLSLVRTNATRVCRDWRTLRTLRALDLRENNVTRLDAADLQWARDLPATVDLRCNPLRTVYYVRADYKAALAVTVRAGAPVTLMLDTLLRCDCGEYWYARAAREAPQHAAALSTARCAGTKDALADRDPRVLLCAAPTEACPRGCACGANELAELRCVGGELRAVPVAPALPPPRALLLASNNITRIAPEDVTPQLEILDLTDNQIVDIDVETASALAAAPSLELRLAGNPLRCDCAALPALRLLAARASSASNDARCATGEPMRAAAARLQAACAPPFWPLALAALVLCAVSAAAAAALGRRAARHRVKRFLFERGLCVRWLLRGDECREDAHCDRDVFVSYAQSDARAAAVLAARLERGGRRTLLHERDWTPGELIPAQIAASVRRSRRTLVLLSEHFLASSWARAELREAYGAALSARRPRLLLVLLPGLEPARASAADAHLRAYIARVTYLRWDDPRFWQRLERALPPPLQAPPPSDGTPLSVHVPES